MDACVSNGSNCGQAAADAFCRYLGFDYNSPSLFTTKQANAPAISMTGTPRHPRCPQHLESSRTFREHSEQPQIRVNQESDLISSILPHAASSVLERTPALSASHLSPERGTEQTILDFAGEWCVSPGQYQQFGHPNRTQFESIQAANRGPYCSVLDSVTCIRHRDSIRSELAAITAPTAAPPSTAPTTGTPQSSRTASVLANPATVSAGRKMMTAA